MRCSNSYYLIGIVSQFYTIFVYKSLQDIHKTKLRGEIADIVHSQPLLPIPIGVMVSSVQGPCPPVPEIPSQEQFQLSRIPIQPHTVENYFFK